MILAPPTPTSHPSPGGHTQPCSKVTAQKPGSQTRNPPTSPPPQLLESDITKTLITDCGYKDMRVEKEDGGGTYPWSISTTIRSWRSVDFLSKPKYHVLRIKASTSLVDRKPQVACNVLVCSRVHVALHHVITVTQRTEYKKGFVCLEHNSLTANA